MVYLLSQVANDDYPPGAEYSEHFPGPNAPVCTKDSMGSVPTEWPWGGSAGIGMVKGLESMDFTNKVCGSPQLLLPT